jgi:hypothetical protein
MKLLSQFISLYLPVVNWLQVLTTVVSLFILVKIALIKIAGRTGWQIRKKTWALERDVWAIE